MLKIKGNKLLSGKISVKGSKNSALALIAASLLNKGKVKLTNVADIIDIRVLIKILEYLDVKCEFNNNELKIDSRNIKYKPLTIEEVKMIRGSSYLMGVFLSLFKKVEIFKPGGCAFSLRPIDYHLKGFETFNANILESDNLTITIDEYKNGYYYIPQISVGTTIDLLLFFSLSENTFILDNIALESEVNDVISFLKLLGVEIEKIKERTLLIKGKMKLKNDVTFNVMNDRIEAGSLALLGALLGDNLVIEGFNIYDNLYLLNIFSKLKVPYKFNENTLYISRYYDFDGIDLMTNPYPLFPTDLQPLMCVFLSMGRKKSSIIENIYPSRLSHVFELNKLGFNLNVNNNKIIINKHNNFINKDVKGFDLRGSFSLLLALLLIEGESILYGEQYIKRGYENIVDRLKSIGADIDEEKDNNS